MEELISKLESYLDGSVSLEAFEAWFNDLAFDVEKTYAGDYVDVIHQIEGILAESSSGGWSDDTLRNELDKVLDSCDDF